MAISINWVSGVVYIPKSYMNQIQTVPVPAYELDVDQMRLDIIDLKDNPDGRPWPKTHIHETESTLSGILYSRKIKYLPPYTFTFEDDQYLVVLIGGNNNISDRKNFNQVSLTTNNSAGKQVIQTGSGLTTEEHDKLMELLEMGEFLSLK